jgi:hypothetical protein
MPAARGRSARLPTTPGQPRTVAHEVALGLLVVAGAVGDHDEAVVEAGQAEGAGGVGQVVADADDAAGVDAVAVQPRGEAGLQSRPDATDHHDIHVGQPEVRGVQAVGQRRMPARAVAGPVQPLLGDGDHPVPDQDRAATVMAQVQPNRDRFAIQPRSPPLSR